MKPMVVAGLVLLALTLVFAVLGIIMTRLKKLRVRHAPTYTRVCTVLVLAAAYGLTHSDWPGMHLRPLDFWSLMVIVGIAAYALIWGPLAHQLNRHNHEEFGESFMLSMLYTDAEHAAQPVPDDKKTDVRK